MDKIDWNQLSNQELPWVFYEAFADKLNWAIISRTHRLTIEFVRKFKSYLDWDAVRCNGNGLSEEVLIFNKRRWVRAPGPIYYLRRSMRKLTGMHLN